MGDEFLEELEVILVEYVEASEDELTDDAIKLKNDTIKLLEKYGFRRVGI